MLPVVARVFEITGAEAVFTVHETLMRPWPTSRAVAAPPRHAPESPLWSPHRRRLTIPVAQGGFRRIGRQDTSDYVGSNRWERRR